MFRLIKSNIKVGDFYIKINSHALFKAPSPIQKTSTFFICNIRETITTNMLLSQLRYLDFGCIEI